MQDDGREVWMFEGAPMPNVGLNDVAGRVPEEYGLDPLACFQMRPGCFDIHERIRDMNVNGLLGSLNFPSLAGFTGQLFSTCGDRELALELLRAYNDWHIEDRCDTYPGRMIPLAVPPIWDVQAMAAEVRRTAEKGCHAVTFSENPEKLGYPSWHSDHWDPFLAACEETGTVICLHIGSSSQVTITAMDAPIDTMITLQPMNIVQCAADLVWVAGVPEVPPGPDDARRLLHVAGRDDALPLFDCDPPVDGSTAVVSLAEHAKDVDHPVARVEAVGTALRGRPSWDTPSPPRCAEPGRSAQEPFAVAGVAALVRFTPACPVGAAHVGRARAR